MHRKTLSLFLLVFVAFSLTLVGCQKSASPSIDELPAEDEAAAMIEDAGDNTSDSQPEDTQVDVTKEPVEKETEAAPEATKETEVAPTPEPTATPEPTPEPTEEATPEPTPEPTEAPAETSEPVVVQSPGTHTVQPGENLFRIALRYGMTVDALAQANGITNPALVYVGQVLKIPSGSGPGDTPPPPSSDGGERTHVVQPGENLFRIALKYNYDQYYLARYNGIDNPALIYVGQVIRIP